MADMSRVQKVLLPIFKGDPRLDGVAITTWVPDVDYREFPMLNIRRIGGIRNPKDPTLQAFPIVEMSCYTNDSLIACEELYETALDVLYDAVKYQTQTGHGHIQSLYEVMGATQFSSLFQDSWRVQGLIKFCIRRPRN